MPQSKYPLIANEGWTYIVPVGLATLASVYGAALSAIDWWLALALVGLLVPLVLLFRDPYREVPSAPRGVISPVDGVVTRVEPTDRGCLEREAMRITIRANRFGAYTARSPIEGKLLDLRDNVAAGSRLLATGGLWVRSDEGDDVVVLLHSPRFIPQPLALRGYGERIGQGQRCAYLRLATEADIYVSANSRIDTKVGDRVRAGSDVLATLVHK